MVDNEIFCPYCGDELITQDDVKAQEEYYRDHGICSHWDRVDIFKEF